MPSPKGGYYIDGVRVPAVTTILGQLGWGKDALLGWANRAGLNGQTLDDARNPAATVGTITHGMIEADVKGEKLDLSALPPEMREPAEMSFSLWSEWRARNVREVVGCEIALVSPTLRVGGTMDLVYIDTIGKRVLLDYKTGAGIYAEALVQVAGYAELYEEATGEKLDRLEVLRLDRDTGSQTHKSGFHRDAPREVFLLARRLYDLQKKVQKDAR